MAYTKNAVRQHWDYLEVARYFLYHIPSSVLVLIHVFWTVCNGVRDVSPLGLRSLCLAL